MPTPLQWWAEKPYSSTSTRIWIKIPISALPNDLSTGVSIKLYYSNPNAQNTHPPSVVFDRVSASPLGYWDFTSYGFNINTKTLFNLVGNYWHGYVETSATSFTPTAAFRPVRLGKDYWDGNGAPICYPYALKDTEYIRFDFGNPSLPSQFGIIMFIDLMRFKNLQPGQTLVSVGGTLLQFLANDLTSLYQLRYVCDYITNPGAFGGVGAARLTLYAISGSGSAVSSGAIDFSTSSFLPVIGNTMPVAIFVDARDINNIRVVTYFNNTLLSTNTLGLNRAIYRLVIGAFQQTSGIFTDFGAPCVGGISLIPVANETEFNNIAVPLRAPGTTSPSLITYAYGCYYYYPAAVPTESFIAALAARDKIYLETQTPNLRYGSSDTTLPGYTRSITIRIRNPEGISRSVYTSQGFSYLTLPINLNTQEAINAGILRADLGDIFPMLIEAQYEPPPPPPPSPPPPSEEPPPAPTLPPGGTCAYTFADTDSENPVFGLAYDCMQNLLRDPGVAFPVPYNSATETIELYPVPPYGVTFTRWMLSYYESGTGVTQSVFGTSLPISVKGLNINWNAGVTIKFFVKGVKGVARRPSSDVNKLNTYSASRYLQLPAIQPEWRSGDFKIRYAVGYNMYKTSGDFRIRYSVGIDYTPANQFLYQNVRLGEENWELVYASPTSNGAHPIKEHFQDYRLRHFHADGNNMYFLLVSKSAPVKVKLVSVNISSGNISASAPVTLGAEVDDEEKAEYPSFGAVAVGHGGIVYANTHGAAYFPFGGTGEPLLLPFLSSMFPVERKKWGAVSVLVVPEGFLFLPYAILWDLDVYYDYATNIDVSDGDRIIPVHFEGVVGVVVRSKEHSTNGGQNIKAFYVWGGFSKGLVQAQVGTAEGMEELPPYLGGSLVKNKWYAFNASAHPDEATIVEYGLDINAQNPQEIENWKFMVLSALKVLPLPFSSPAARARWKPPAWGEIWGFNTAANAYYLYFSRVWDRIYRLDVESKEIYLAHSIPYLDFGGNLISRFMGGEEAWMMFSYNLEHGRVYCAHLRSGERLQIWRQSQPVTPPPAPTIIFPPTDIQVPRQFDVQFKPHAYDYPQEFSITITAETANGVSVWHYYSTLHRNLFEVSTDNGLNFAPMSGPVTVNTNNDGSVVVKFNIPYPLPPSASVTITVRAIGVIT